MSEHDDPKTLPGDELSEDELDAVQGAGIATIDFVQTSGEGDDQAASSSGTHRRIHPIEIMKRID